MVGAAVGAAAIFGGSASARADLYGFTGLSANNVADVAIAEAQLFVEVTAEGATQVKFRFYNTGPAASSITDVYFDDGTLLGIASIVNGSGVDFSQGASPGDLPGGNLASPAFEATAGFTADSDAPTQPNGVNPGEEVSIIFNLQGGGTFADVIAELTSGELRIGIHVQGFATGGSESLINGPPGTPPIPAPGAFALAALGFGAIGAIRRRLV